MGNTDSRRNEAVRNDYKTGFSIYSDKVQFFRHSRAVTPKPSRYRLANCIQYIQNTFNKAEKTLDVSQDRDYILYYATCVLRFLTFY